MTKTKCACRRNTQCLPVRMSRDSAMRPAIIGGVQLRYSFRLYPDAPQREALARAFGCARVVFNDALAARQAAHEAGEPYIPDAELSRRLTEAKKDPARAWLGEVSAVVLLQALGDLNAAYRNFFASVAGTRTGPKIAAPRFRSRKDRRQAVRFTANARFRVLGNGRLRLPKVGDVPARWSRDLPSDPSSVTVIRDAAGRFFASFVIETSRDPLPQTGRECGIDLGLGHFAVLDDGTKVAARSSCVGRRRSSARRNSPCPASRRDPRTGRRPAYRSRGRTPGDFHHKLSTAIIRENQAVYVEDLCVAGLGRTRLAKSVHDAGWSSFTRMLEYKAALYGREFARIGRWEPTSQLCSACGVKDGPKPLHVRMWECKACGAVHDRDVNAARNIAALGRREARNARGGQVRPGAIPAPACEAGSISTAA